MRGMNKLVSRSLCSSILRAPANTSSIQRSTTLIRSVHGKPCQKWNQNALNAVSAAGSALSKTTLPSLDWCQRALSSSSPLSTTFNFVFKLQHEQTRHLSALPLNRLNPLDERVYRSVHAIHGVYSIRLHTSTRNRNKILEHHHFDKSDSHRDGKVIPQKTTSTGSTNPDELSAPGTVTGSRKNLIDRLPQLPHRPSREELLAAATGFWSRLKVRFKWFSIRSARPFNVDEIGAFFSWVVLGHVLWIALGTTTFFSLAIFAVNTVFAQETVAGWVGNYLTKSSGIKVVFESAIVPKWGDGVITFKNVFVSRRPGHGKGQVSKGSPATEAAAAAATAQSAIEREDVDEDTNFTQFDLSLDTVNVTLSFNKWFNSKGLLRDVEVRGVRGVVDRTSVHSDGGDVDPRSYKHKHNLGDFEIDSFKMSDLLVTVHQPKNFRPFEVSIFNCDLPLLRRQWLFYDFLSANQMSGHIDNSIFSLHPRQDHSFVGSNFGSRNEVNEGDTSPWKKSSRLRLDALNIDHLNRGVEGPFGWIHQGNVDIVADIMFPADNDESIGKLMSDFYDRMEATVTSNKIVQIRVPSEPPVKGQQMGLSEATTGSDSNLSEDDGRFLVMDLRIHLNNIRAAVPLFNKDLSYVNNALVRPIVAYMNSRHTFIPVHCRVVKRVNEFDGSWTIFDSGLMDDMSAEVCAPVFESPLVFPNPP